jgi:DNA-binding NtrC family response regulator
MAKRDILIVDDDRQVREVLNRILIAAGYNTLLATDGYEGLEVFRKARPPLVVTDLRHPGINGIELLRQVRAVDGDAAVIVLTAVANVKTAIASLKLGAYAFLMKPINMDELLITVERALERRQLLIEHREHQQAYGQLQEAQRDVLILVVEEERQVREALRQIFDAAGYKCLLSGDVEEGLKVFGRSRPDLIVTDLGMPMSAVEGTRSREAGFELLKLVCHVDPDAAVIVMSGTANVKIAIASLKLGAHAFLMKPINMDELLITAERALELRQLLIERRQYQRPESQEGT